MRAVQAIKDAAAAIANFFKLLSSLVYWIAKRKSPNDPPPIPAPKPPEPDRPTGPIREWWRRWRSK